MFIISVSQGGRGFVSPCSAIIESCVQVSFPNAHIRLLIDFSNSISLL